MTRSPGEKCVTEGPTARTVPAMSEPRTVGLLVGGSGVSVLEVGERLGGICFCDVWWMCMEVWKRRRLI